MPLGQHAGVLRQVVGTCWDHAVHAAGYGSCATRIGDEKLGLAAFDDSLGRGRIAQERLVLFETSDKFLAILGLECGISPFASPES
jgi:hypothetical protein